MVFDRIRQYFRGRSGKLSPERPPLSGAVEADISQTQNESISHHHSLPENGTAENGVAENGAAENGAAENGAAENGVAENRAAENRTAGHENEADPSQQPSFVLPVFSPEGSAPLDDPLPPHETVSTLKKRLDADAFNRAIEKAGQLYNAGEWDHAVDQCRVVLELDSSHAPIHKLLGNTFLHLGQKDEARSAYQQALVHDPAFSDVYVNLGNLEAQDKQWDEAIAHYQQAIALKPDFAGAYRNLAKVWRHKGNERLATECLFHAIEQEPDSLDGQGYLNLGNQLLAQGQPKQAIYCYRYLLAENKRPANETRLADSDPSRSPFSEQHPLDLPILHQKLADALAQTEQWQEAVVHYRQAQQIALSNGLGQTQSPDIHQSPAQSHHKLDSLALSSPSSTMAIRPASVFQSAQGLEKQGKWDQVVNVLKQELEAVEPALNQRYELLAKALRIEGNGDGAMEYYKKMLMLYPNQAKPFANLGSIYAQKEQWQDAKAAYQQAIQLEPNFAGAYRNLARVWQSTGDEAVAADCWVKAYELEPDWGDASDHLALGQTLVTQGKGEAAIAAFNRAIAKDDTLTVAYFQLAELHRQNGRDDLAMFHYGKALQSDRNQSEPNHCDAIYELGQLLTKHGDMERAIACFQKLIQTEVESIRGYTSLRNILVEQNRLDEALICYQWLAKLQPSSSDAHHQLGDVLTKLERWEEAIPAFQRSIELNPTFFWSYNNLGTALNRLEKWQKSVDILTHAIQLNADFHWTHYSLGEALAELGYIEDALTAYRSAVALKPDSHLIRSRLNHTIEHQIKALSEELSHSFEKDLCRDDNDVQRFYDAIELEPHNAQLYLRLANFLVNNQQTEEAVVFYTIASNLELENPQVNIHIGKALEKISYYSESIRAFQRVLDVQPDLKEAEKAIFRLKQFQNERDLTFKQSNSITPEQHKISEQNKNKSQAPLKIKVYPPSSLLLLRSFSYENQILPDFDVQRIDVPEAVLYLFPFGQKWTNPYLAPKENSAQEIIDIHQSNDLADAHEKSSGYQGLYSALELKKTSIFLPTCFAEGEYIAWIFKFMAQLILIESGGFVLQSIDLILVNYSVPNYVQELMMLLHIPMPNIIKIDQYSHVQSSPLIVSAIDQESSGHFSMGL